MGKGVGTGFVAGLLALLAGGLAAPAKGDIGDELMKLLASDGETDDEFGSAVAITGATALIGAPDDDDRGVNAGAVYLFDIPTGAQLTKLVAPDGAAGDRFGYSIAVAGLIAAIGAEQDDDKGADSGSVYIIDLTNGQQLMKLVASDGAAGDRFGSAVAIDGSTLVVGARRDGDNGEWSGSVYVFDLGTGQQVGKLLADDGTADDHLGWSVAVAGSLVLAGAPLDNLYDTDSGCAYIFDLGTMVQVAKLTPPSGGMSDNFGRSVAISGAIALVGSPGDREQASSAGAVYYFDTATGQQIAKLFASDGGNGHHFGIALAVDEPTLIVGAYRDPVNDPYSGSAYLFDVQSRQQLAKLVPADGAYDDYFGNAVAIGGATVLVGAFRDDDRGEDAGSAYLFDADRSCAPDLDGDGDVDTLDFLAFLNAWSARDPLADWDANGLIDSRDFIAYLGDWVAGC